MASQININFHQTFKPEKKYIGSILDIANHTGSLSIQEISLYTGIPNGKSSGKVEPHIYYTKYMGLINAEKKDRTYEINKTRLGNIVSLEDPGLQEELSILLCHAMMLRPYKGAAMWNAIFMKLLPAYQGKIKKDILLKELGQLFNGKVSKKNLAPFLGSYEEMFSVLDILKVDTNNCSEMELPYNKEFIYLYAYILLEYWDELYSGQGEISSAQLAGIGFGKAFGWNEQKEYEVLEHLSDKGLLRLNRQLAPYTILRLADKNFAMDKLYSELC